MAAPDHILGIMALCKLPSRVNFLYFLAVLSKMSHSYEVPEEKKSLTLIKSKILSLGAHSVTCRPLWTIPGDAE